MNNFYKGIKILRHSIEALFDKGKDDFIRNFRRNILRGKCPVQDTISQYRNELSTHKEFLVAEDFGAGSLHKKNIIVADASKRTGIRPVYGKILYNLCRYYKPDNVVELGTAFGISTLYLSAGNPQTLIWTVEGNHQMHGIASDGFSRLDIHNITAINGIFDDVLPYLKEKCQGKQLYFIDGNHTYDATIRYFKYFFQQGAEQIFVFDDINWSKGMADAWEEIKNLHRDVVIIDLFQLGIVMHFQDTLRKNYHL